LLDVDMKSHRILWAYQQDATIVQTWTVCFKFWRLFGVTRSPWVCAPASLAELADLMLGSMMGSFIALIIEASCMAWWLPNKSKPRLLRKHEENTKDETINLGSVEMPLSEAQWQARYFIISDIDYCRFASMSPWVSLRRVKLLSF
jgi:hypothetical protein